ncbi:Com family DNA-binding transcriptional regulator [Desulfurispirillum indicum]|uniref:Com family DNA-binding transcriptional regulator n=2 Tax=Desulfurispirillum TaxID=393029 RepID=E6W2J6_DESIS|nr:hypothetical protein Selin_2026 [Desulfurispirillum indicum S5]UCZ56068.1 Com family DNA-binding transcriptional regulator [Desulfurispirillum indicum]
MFPHQETSPCRCGRAADAALPEVRCKRCKRLLFKGYVVEVEMKCPKCGAIQRFDYAYQCRERHPDPS